MSPTEIIVVTKARVSKAEIILFRVEAELSRGKTLKNTNRALTFIDKSMQIFIPM